MYPNFFVHTKKNINVSRALNLVIILINSIHPQSRQVEKLPELGENITLAVGTFKFFVLTANVPT